MEYQKGLTLGEGLNAVVIVGLIGLFLGFFALFNDEIAVATSSNRDTVAVINESGWINTTGYTLDKASVPLSQSFSLTALYNATDDSPILLGNATVSSLGVVTNASVVAWNNVLISYTYTAPTTTENISLGLNTEYQNQTDILGLVLLAVFFGIAITALLASFMFRRRRI